MRSRSTDWPIEKAPKPLPYKLGTTSTMRQYRDEHALIFQPAPLHFSNASLILSCTPKSTGTEFSELIPVVGGTGKSACATLGSELEARAEPIDKSRSA